jgi:predicted SAM-dependent methyltransferase
MYTAKNICHELSWVGYTLWRRIRQRALTLRRVFIRPNLPVNSDGKVRIHLGCGDIASPQFINVDARSAPHVHYVSDVTDLFMFSDKSADLVYACHVLEHVRHNALKRTLWEWRRVLKPGGILRLSVPDFDKIIHIYCSSSHNMESIQAPLMGGQTYEQNAHYTAFNCQYLSGLLKEAGFREVREWNARDVSDHEFVDWANSEITLNGRAFPISLNLEAVR